MRYLMLMWADADAASGDESDFQAWVDFDERVKAAGAFVLNGALTPAATDARLVQTSIAGHALVKRHLGWLQEYLDLGFAELYLHHVGQHNDAFIDAFGAEVLPTLRGAV